MEKKERKIVKSLVIALPLRLFGCKYDDELRIDFYDNDEVEVFMPVSAENLAHVPEDFDTSGQGILSFAVNEKDVDRSYMCTTFGYGVWTERTIEDLLKNY